MPVKNAGQFLDECLASIVRQTHRTWELIVVNDHSEDATEKILKKWSEQDSRISFIINEGYGIISALNLGTVLAKGQFITRMDGDDLMHPEKLSSLLAGFSIEPDAGVVVGKVAYFSEEELGAGYQAYAEWLNSLIDNESHWREIYRECVIPSPCWMMKKSDLLGIGGFTDADYPEDYDFSFRLYANNYKVTTVKRVIHYWRDHQARSSRTMAVYQDPWFLKIKLRYFKKLEIKYRKPVLVWGSGKKGKIIAKDLLAAGIEVVWLSNNPKKQSIEIHGIMIKPVSIVKEYLDLKMIIAVGNKQEKDEIRAILSGFGLSEGVQYFMFS